MNPNVNSALLAGAAGAVALNVVHESARNFVQNAPQVHKPAMLATWRYIFKPLGIHSSRRSLYFATLAGDLVSNALFYASVVGGFTARDPKSVWKRAALFGLGAGALTVVLPPRLGLHQQPTRNFAKTAALTTAWYLVGALTAAAVFNSSQRKIKFPVDAA